MANYTAQQWRTVDVTVHTDKNYRNPFEDVDVFGEFTAPSKEVKKILGFWNGNGEWIVRFAPTEIGEWKYKITSTDANEDFVEEGTVEAVAYEGTLAMYQHGFLRVSEDHTHFVHADGTPFFWLGDTHWTFVTEEPWDSSNCPADFKDADAKVNEQMHKSIFKACVDKRVRQKFTVYQSNFRDGNSDGFFGKNIDLMQETENGYLPNLELFQKNADLKMKYIADQGLYHAVGYAWGFDTDRHPVERYMAFAKYTMARYGAFPVAWTLAGELPGYMGDKEALMATWNKVALEAHKYNAYKNLCSVHLACSRPFPVIYKDEPWFDFAMSQAGHGDYDMNGKMYYEFVENYKGHPVLESEATYEGARSNEYVSRVIGPDMMRRLAYLCIQAGGCGYTYGCNGVWELQIEAGVGGIGWGDMAWWNGLELPGADQLTIMRDFYESVDWASLKPLPVEKAKTKSFFMEADARTSIYFTGNEDMTTVVGYAQPTAMRVFELNGLTANKYEGYWVNPENGEKTPFDHEVIPENGTYTYQTRNFFANKKDALVVLRAVK